MKRTGNPKKSHQPSAFYHSTRPAVGLFPPVDSLTQLLQPLRVVVFQIVHFESAGTGRGDQCRFRTPTVTKSMIKRQRKARLLEAVRTFSFSVAMKTEDTSRLAELQEKLRSREEMAHHELVELLRLQGRHYQEEHTPSSTEMPTRERSHFAPLKT
jgi:hypothetical protein